MPRFYLPPEQCNGAALVLAGREAHHALHVLRVRAGDRVTVLNGAGREFACQVDAITGDQLNLAVLEQRSILPAQAHITLLQALPKGKLIESIIQKATELGVTRIVPIVTDRVIARPDSKEAHERGEKLQGVAIEALKQCGAPWLPRVEPPVSLDDFISRCEPFELALVGSLQPGSLHPRECLHSFFNQTGRLPRSLAVWIGPEGDFTPAEILKLQQAGARPITLGALVLRSETAAVYCLSILQYELQPSPSSPFLAA
jgi:16S rRNA (uracil1498-N3)-methyltransferase